MNLLPLLAFPSNFQEVAIPRNRFGKLRWSEETPRERLQKINTVRIVFGTLAFRGGHFLTHDIAKFDAPFFNISDTEVAALDPQ
jgi:hypothetical protein